MLAEVADGMIDIKYYCLDDLGFIMFNGPKD